MASTLQKNVAGQNITFVMVTTSGTAATSATVSVYVTGDNGSQAAGAGAVTNLGNGQYNYAPTKSETNFNDVGFMFTASGCIPENLDFHTVAPFVPPSPSSFGAAVSGGLSTPGSRFLTPVDIANRALQHLGAARIDPNFGFNEDSRNASEIASCYAKLRRAELQRNVWTKATKKTCLRPVDTNTLLLAPTLWEQDAIYFVGSVVDDGEGTFWQSKFPDNSGNDPQNSTAWEPYFGPATVSLYDNSMGYFAGENVYTAAGDGTFNVYRSNITDNNVHPAMPNLWLTDTTFYKDAVVIVYPAWSSVTTYGAGAQVSYTDGNYYTSLVAGNLDNIPPSSASKWVQTPTLTIATQQVPSSNFPPPSLPTVSPIIEWSQDLYFALGSFAMFNGSMYVAIANSTGEFPDASASTYWAECTGGALYQSLININVGNNPANTPADWSSVTTYAAGNTVAGSDGYNYTSLQNSNTDKDPADNANPTWWTQGSLTAWTSSFTQGGGNFLWTQIGGAAFPAGVSMSALQITWPAASGPTWQGFTKNVYRLPVGYLRRAPQDPKAGRVSYLGAPSNRPMDDWEYDDDYLLTTESRPIVFRFVADIQDVTKMPDMFCEGLACRIANEVCEPITQSGDKKRIVMAEYDKFMGEARLANAIEQGVDEPPLDDWINCRY